MDSRIVGGGTRPAVAYVDEHGRLYTYSVQVPLQHWESHVHGQGFITNIIKYDDAAQYLAVDSYGGPMLAIVNRSSDKAMVLTRLIGSTTQPVIIWMHRFSSDKILHPDTSLAGYRELTVKNTNFGRTDPSEVVAIGWDGSTGSSITGITLAEASALSQLYVPGAGVVDVEVQDNWIAPPNSTLICYARAPSTTANITLLVAGYLHGEEFEG